MAQQTSISDLALRIPEDGPGSENGFLPLEEPVAMDLPYAPQADEAFDDVMVITEPVDVVTLPPTLAILGPREPQIDDAVEDLTDILQELGIQ